MTKSDKELAVEIACAVIQSAALRAQVSSLPVKPLTGDEIRSILSDAYSAVSALPADTPADM